MLASGSGTNLQALIEAPRVRPRITIVVSDRERAGALDRAVVAGIDTAVVPFGDFADREAFSVAVADAVERSGAKGVILAGFMRVLSPSFIERFPGRILNIHPSLLPAFPGTRAVESALISGAASTGVTVHFVDEKVDHGPIVVQHEVPIEPGDDVDTLHRRIQQVEHVVYPEIVGCFVAGDLYLEEGNVVWE